MAYSVGDFLVQRLHAWGVHRIYGYPGDGINGIMGALERAERDPEFIQARHEELAAFMACAHAKVTCLILPNDLQELEAVESPKRVHGATFSGVGYAPPHVVPTDVELRKAADILNAGKKIAMLVGAGALGATDEVIETADLLGCGIAKALLGKAAVPDDLPN